MRQEVTEAKPRPRVVEDGQAPVIDRLVELNLVCGKKALALEGSGNEIACMRGYLGALTHHQIVALLERNVFQAELFDEKQVVEVVDPENPKRRYGQWHVQQRLKPLS